MSAKDGKKVIITEVSVKRDLQLENEEGVDCLPNSTIFEPLTLMGYEKISQKLTFYKAFFSPQWKFLIHIVLQCLSSKTTTWNMASAIIYLATNRKFNFSKYIFESMVRNLENVSSKFLMYPRFVQVFLDKQLDGMSTHNGIYDAPSHTKKIFGNMRRVGKGFSGRVTPLFPKMVVQNQAKLGGGPGCQDTMGDTIAQTRFANVSKLSNDLLLARGNILQSDDDRLKLNELMELCTNLQKKVLDLEKINTTQANEIASLKGRVNKLEQKKRSRTHGLKRLYKVGLTARVESSGDEEDLGEDASKQGRRINAIDVDEDITVVNDDAHKEMFGVDTLNGEEVLVDKGKGILVEPDKPLKKKEQLKLDEEIALKLQAEIDEEERIARAAEEKIDETNIAWDDIQAKVDADYQLAERLQPEEQEQFTNEEKDTLFKELLEQRRKHFAAKRAEEKRNKTPNKTQQKKTMITYLKNMEGWKHKDLKFKDFNSIKEMFDKAFTRVNMFVDFRTELVEGSSKRAREELEQENEEDVTIDVVPLATKSPSIVDWKIHKEGKKSYYQIVRADGKSQMYKVFSQMLKSFTREDLEDRYKLVKAKYGSIRPVEDLDLGRIVGIKSLLNAPSITAALIDVNVAQYKVTTARESYYRLRKLLLLVKVKTA
ncbi:hypothetical protein Tco_1315685 [Tanacetum coccineum]